jgi:hypothetical protein
VPDSALATFAAELKAWRERMELTRNAFADKIGDVVTGRPGRVTAGSPRLMRQPGPGMTATSVMGNRSLLALGIRRWLVG